MKRHIHKIELLFAVIYILSIKFFISKRVIDFGLFIYGTAVTFLLGLEISNLLLILKDQVFGLLLFGVLFEDLGNFPPDFAKIIFYFQ